MKKRILLLLLSVAFILNASAQTPQLYNPFANAKADIANAVSRAGNEGKHVFLQIGGNWCVWCLRFNQLILENDTLSTVMNKNFIVVHVNYSRENRNEETLATLGFPQRFGFPVFVILDGKGNRLHTQNSAYLEQGEGHSTKKVLDFLNAWTPKALDPKSYKK